MKIETLRNIFVASLIMFMSGTGIKAANLDVSSLNETIQGAEALNGNNIVKQIATNFSTGSFTGTADIWLVQLYLNSFSTYNLANLSVRIFTDNAGVPGAAVGTALTATGSLTTGGVVDFTNIGSPVSLAPSTNYWVVIKNTVSTSNTNLNWAYGYPTSPTVGLNATLGTTQAVNSVGTGWTTFANTAQLVRITNVPEPSTYALGTIGALTMGYVARRRKTAKV